MDRTCAVAWAVCAVGLAVATWAAVSTPQRAVINAEHHGSIPRVQPARHKGESDPAVTYFMTQAIAG